MNNIRGFSSSLLPTTQFPASDLAKQHDAATPNKQSNAFGDVLTGLSQQGGQQAASSSGNPNSNGWKALASERFSAAEKDSNLGASFSADATLSEAPAVKTVSPALAPLKNPHGPSSTGVTQNNSLSHDEQTPGATSKLAGTPTAADFNGAGSTRALLGRAIAGAAAPLVSPQTDVEQGADLPASASGSAKPTNKVPESTASKSSAQSAATSQPAAKTAVQTPTLPGGRQQQTAAASANVETSAQLATPGIATSVGQYTTQTSGSSSSSNAERRRRAESDSAQTSVSPNTDAQQLAGAAMAMPITPAAAASQGSQTSADSTHGLSSAHADPAKAILSALDAEPEPETDEQLGAPIKLDSVSQATHFAPVAWLSPTQQIVDAVGTALGSQSTSDVGSGAAASTSAASPTSPSGLSTTSRSSPLSLKTLDLQLDPQNLGAVSIKLNLSATGLTVEVQASQASTADLLEKDKHALTDGLNGAGYSVSGVDISFAPSSGASGFTDQGLTQNSFGQSSGDSQANSGSQTQGGANDSFSRQNSNQDRHGNPETTRSAAQRSAGTGLYI